MKKRIVCALLCAAMAVSMFAGCGDKGGDTQSSAKSDTPKSENEYSVSDDGKVLNIYVWNEEFKSRVTAHYPGYEEVDATTGKIGDVTVKWNITPNQDGAYQKNLDEALLKQKDASADDKIDIFLVEADYAKKYADTAYSVPVSEVGVTDSDTANQYQYTKDVVTDPSGALKGVSWQSCPGVMFYNREAAKEVLGTDDPAEVQKHVSDWDKFMETAKEMKDKGYLMTASASDTYRAFANNVTSKGVTDDGKINVDDNILKWVDMSKEMVDAKETTANELWSDDWSKGFYPNGKVFCYFGPAWFINFSMAADDENSIAHAGGWGATEGPQGFFWGGTWICGANYTDNSSLVKDIMLKLTCDEDIMTDIVVQDDDFVNNKNVMEALASGEKKVKDENGKEVEYTSKLLGGQNPLPMYIKGVENIDMKNITKYEQGCTEEMMRAMNEYYSGNTTKDEALAAYEKAMQERYPDLAQ